MTVADMPSQFTCFREPGRLHRLREKALISFVKITIQTLKFRYTTSLKLNIPRRMH